MMPEKKTPVDMLNAKPSEMSALKKALESDNLEEVAQSLPGKLREEAKIVIQGPSFLGTDKAGKTWQVTAAKAYQERNSTLLNLENVAAHRAAIDPSAVIKLNAPKGNFDDTQSLLHLMAGFTGNLRAMDISGRTANYNLKEQLANGDDFAAYGKNGELLAQVFDANMIDEKFEFTGGVRVKFKLKPKTSEAQ